MDSPNLASLDRWGFEVRRVDKPWGYELIWALTDTYCGKVLFVRAGHALSLQFHREKDESWLVHAGRAKVELGEMGNSVLNEEVVAPGAAFRFAPGTVHRVTAIEPLRQVTRGARRRRRSFAGSPSRAWAAHRSVLRARINERKAPCVALQHSRAVAPPDLHAQFGHRF